MWNIECCLFSRHGYEWVFIQRHSSMCREGEATFYRTSRFGLEANDGLVLSQVAQKVCLIVLFTSVLNDICLITAQFPSR